MGQIQGDQIVNGTITSVDISSTAGITTSQLADGARIPIKETNGDLILSGTLSLSDNKISNLAAPSDSADATRKSYVDSAVSTAVATSQALCVLLSKWKVNQIPSGTVDGSNRVFTLPSSPVAGTVQLFRGGVLDFEGPDDDYQISGSTITYNVGKAPAVDYELRANYIEA